MNLFQLPSPVEELKSDFLSEHKVQLFVKRDDLIHPEISGNKWRKLKYNIEEAKRLEKDTLLTFGGAFSNHLIATAVAAKGFNLKSIAVVRGERAEKLSDTLKECEVNGMQLHFVSRAVYREKETVGFLNELEELFGSFFLVPEGGGNELGKKGCEEVLSEVNESFDVVCCAAGTGTTAAGLYNSIHREKLFVFPVLKGMDFEKEEIFSHSEAQSKTEQLHFFKDYHFGGYAKINDELIDFCRTFYASYGMKLDLVYTAKMFYGIFDLIKKGHFGARDKLLAIHTGGLQGNRGMEKRFNFQLF